GSIRWSWGPESDATHTASASSTSPSGVVPISSSVATTALVCGSIRCTAGASVFDTQTDPDASSMSCGPDSTSIVAITFPAAGSIRDTDPSTKLETQRLPNAASTNRGDSPTSTVPVIRSVAGSIRPTVSSSSHTTQTDPSVPAIPSGA